MGDSLIGEGVGGPPPRRITGGSAIRFGLPVAIALLAVSLLYGFAAQRYQTTPVAPRFFTVTDRLTGSIRVCRVGTSVDELTCGVNGRPGERGAAPP
jgi:hypothetical protein